MKQKISVSIDEKMVKIIEKLLDDRKFRNRSHVIEFALDKIIGERIKWQKIEMLGAWKVRQVILR